MYFFAIWQLYFFSKLGILHLVIFLLWLTQALASERELVLSLLDPDSVADTGPIAQRFSKISDNDLGKMEPDLTFVLDRIFEGVCRPFKVRVEQVLQSQPNLIISYKLSNTLEFYSHTVSLLYSSLNTSCCYFSYSLNLTLLPADIRLARKGNSSQQYTLGSQGCCSKNIFRHTKSPGGETSSIPTPSCC